MSAEGMRSAETITARGYAFIAFWVLGLLLLAAAAGYGVSSHFYECKLDSIVTHDRYLEPMKTPHENSSQKPIDVYAGIYLDRISLLSVRDNKWTADFYIWFKWNGDGIDPGENFQLVYGEIKSKQKQFERVTGDEHYQQYEVIAEITKFFNTTRFPCDDHLLMIPIEDCVSDSSELRYVPDLANSGISRNVRAPGYEILQMDGVGRQHVYETSFGDPAVLEGKLSFSQFLYTIWIVRPGWGLYLKIFQGLFIAVAVAMLAFFIRPVHTSPRFSVGLGALFAAVANSYIVSSMQPGSEIFTLADMVSGIGIATIFLTLVQSTISLYIYDSLEARKLSRLFDLVSAAVFFLGYISVNIAVPLAAML